MNKISKNTLTKRQKEVVSIFEELMPHLKTTKTISRKEIVELLEMCEKNWDGKSKKVGYPKFLTKASNKKSFSVYWMPVDPHDEFDDDFKEIMSEFGIT